jgi:diacylglycerol kinase (ATP)
VIDLSKSGPTPGLDLIMGAENVRAVACGGDGTVGWVLQEAEKRGVTNLQLGVLPLGTVSERVGGGEGESVVVSE